MLSLSARPDADSVHASPPPERAEASLPASPEAEVLRAAADWLGLGHRVWIATVLSTYGSAPRPIGSMAAINDLGQVAGSVSGGCVEDDLSEWLARDALACAVPRIVAYGRDADERARLKLPCNGHIEVWLEPAPADIVRTLRLALHRGQVMVRRIDLRSGQSNLQEADGSMRTKLHEHLFEQILGPRYRLVLIGASEVSRYLAPIAITLGFSIEVVDPRREYLSTWPHPGCMLHAEMPDDVLAMRPPDSRTAVVALSHDPKLDDLALMEALRSPLLYVGAMGSVRTTEARKQRLALFDLDASQLAAIRGPVGADIGARTPPEIAVAIAADLVAATRSDG